MGSERNVFPHLGEEFLRPRFAGKFEHFFAADDTRGGNQRIGDHGAFAAAAEALSRARGVFKPESARGRSDNGGIDGFYAAGEREFLSGPRPAEYLFRRQGRRPAVAQLCGSDDQLWFGISEWRRAQPFAELLHSGFVAG